MDAYSSDLIYLLSVNGNSEEIEARRKKEKELQLSEKKALEDKCIFMTKAMNKLERQLNSKKKYEEELKNVSETNPNLKDLLQEINRNWAKKDFIGKLEAEQFRSMNQDQQVKLLAKQGYEDFNAWFVEKKRYIHKISMTTNNLLIFVCKYYADCNNHAGIS